MHYLPGVLPGVLAFLSGMNVYAETIPDDGVQKAAIVIETDSAQDLDTAADANQAVAIDTFRSFKAGDIRQADTTTNADTLMMKLAVPNFIGRGIDSVSALGYSDRFRIYLSQNCPLPVLEPGQVDLILKDRGYRGGELCDHNDCLIEMGRFLGIRYLIAGSIGKISDISTLAVRIIDVQTGKVHKFILKDTRMAPQEILDSVIPRLAEECSDQVIRLLSATITIKSIPENAKIMMNEVEIGWTPMTLKNIGEGKGVLRLQMKNYRDIIDTLFLEKGKETVKMYTLQITDEYAGILREKRITMRERIMQGTAVFGCIAAVSVGGYYNSKLRDVVDTQKKIINNYNEAGVGADYSGYKKRYDEQAALFDRWKAYRNFGYIAGVVLAAGVTVTFFF